MDIEKARFNMVEQQIRPWDVLDQDVLDLLFVVRREDFVPPEWRAMAFTDMEIPLTVAGRRTGQVMLAPKVEARLLQSLALTGRESVLEIGAGSGHMAALLAHRSRAVRTLEIDAGLADFARENLRRAGLPAVTVEHADGSAAPASTYDAIVLSGAVAAVPAAFREALSVGGRLVAIVGEAPVMTARRITRIDATTFSDEPLFDTLATPLAGFPQAERFHF